MACPQILTGNEFVTRMVTHIDCQSRYLGSYGYTALGEPGSIAASVMTGLLTLFIAIWGYRMLVGQAPRGRDFVGDALKLGIVLTLAFSWPAFRTVVHDLVLDGPAQIASSLSNPGLAPTGAGFVERLQGVDRAILGMIDVGTGRQNNQFLEGQAGVASMAGTALQDDGALGWARLVYLSGLIASLGLLRLVAGLLLALAPLAAGLLLFEATRGLFAGWLRGLVLTLIGSVGVTVVLAVELAVLEPYLTDAFMVRSSGYGAPGVPIELFAIVTGFTLVQLLSIWLLAKVAFMRGWAQSIHLPDFALPAPLAGSAPAITPRETAPLPNRAERVAELVETRMRFEQGRMVNLPAPAVTGGSSRTAAAPSGGASTVTHFHSTERLGSSYRRNRHSRSMRTSS